MIFLFNAISFSFLPPIHRAEISSVDQNVDFDFDFDFDLALDLDLDLDLHVQSTHRPRLSSSPIFVFTIAYLVLRLTHLTDPVQSTSVLALWRVWFGCFLLFPLYVVEGTGYGVS
jgi:hypothetical protein